jgi:putative phage-type endonuclease
MSLSQEQLEFRKRGIGSSDIAAICGEDPNKSALDVWIDKTGRGGTWETNDQAELGHMVEPILAARFAARHGVEVETLTTMAHPDVPFAVATPDRWIRNTRELIETKNVGYRMMRRWRGPAGSYATPPYVQIQEQWQCFVTGTLGVWTVALLGGRDFYEERFDADTEFAAALVSVAERFWEDHVLTGIPPEPDASEAAKRVLDRLYPKSNGRLIDSNDEIAEWAAKYAVARIAEKTAKTQRAEAANRLRALLGDASGTDEAPWGHVAWMDKRGRTEWRAVAKELGATPDLIKKHTGPGARSLTVAWNGTDDEDEEG